MSNQPSQQSFGQQPPGWQPGQQPPGWQPQYGWQPGQQPPGWQPPGQQPPRRKLKSGHIVAVGVGVVLLCCICAGIALAIYFGNTQESTDGGYGKVDTDVSVSTDSWVIYWYVCGSDLESRAGLATSDMKELQQTKLPDNVRVVIQTGGSQKWHSDVSASATQRYLYDKSGLHLLESLPQKNMGTGETLADFLTWANTSYPAENRVLIFWNHGGGSLSGVAFDENFAKDSITLVEMRQALSDSSTTRNSEPLYELIGFDTCLMATVEATSILQSYGRYLVASQEVTPGYGWDYAGLLESITQDRTISGAQLGRDICDDFFAGTKMHGDDGTAMLSVVDLGKATPLIEAYRDMGNEALIKGSLDSDYFAEFGRAARLAENYENSDSSGYTNMVDLGDLVSNASDLLPQSADGVLNALDNCVIYQVKGTYRSNGHGLSCYYSYDGSPAGLQKFVSCAVNTGLGYYFEYSLSGELSQAGRDYVRSISAQYTQQPVEVVPLPDLSAAGLEGHALSVNANGHWQLNLGSDLVGNLSAVYIALAWNNTISPEGGQAIFGVSHDVSGDWNNGVFADSFDGTWGAIDNLNVFMEPIAQTAEYTLYTVPLLINDQRYNLFVAHDTASDGWEMLGASQSPDVESGMMNKELYQLQVGDIIQPIQYYLLPEGMTDVETGQRLVELPLGEGTISEDSVFHNRSVGDGSFSVMFIMIDHANNSYYSAPGNYQILNRMIQAQLPNGSWVETVANPFGLSTEALAIRAVWHGSAVLGSGYAERYALRGDGSFIWACSTMDTEYLLRYQSGYWNVVDGILRLAVTEEVRWTGNYLSNAPSYYASDRELYILELEEPLYYEIPIGALSNDAATGYDTLTIGGRQYWDFSYDPEIMNDHMFQRADAMDQALSDDSKKPTVPKPTASLSAVIRNFLGIK